jgi:hypothetical protein
VQAAHAHTAPECVPAATGFLRRLPTTKRRDRLLRSRASIAIYSFAQYKNACISMGWAKLNLTVDAPTPAPAWRSPVRYAWPVSVYAVLDMCQPA